MADRPLRVDESHPSRGELDQLDFDHHREERRRWAATSGVTHERGSSDDRSNGSGDYGWRGDGTPGGFASGSQEFGRWYDGGYREARYGGHEWIGTETWRVPGPFAGRGPRGYQRSDDRIHEELNDRLTAHGFIDATDIECSVHNGEVTLSGFVDSPDAKRAAEIVAEGIQGVLHDVHNNLRVRSPKNAEGVGGPKAVRPTENRSRARTSAHATDAGRARSRTKGTARRPTRG